MLLQRISKLFLRIHMKLSLHKRFGILFSGYVNIGVEIKNRMNRDFSLVCSTVRTADLCCTFQEALP